jgi:hypothetical protein
MTKTPVAETIISLLEKGSVSRKELIEKVCKLNTVTMQAVYKEIKSLITSGKILSHKDALSLNLLYISKQYDRWSSVLNHYEGGQNLKNHFLDLQESESITLKFKTLNSLDAYWTHAFLILYKHNTSKRPSFSIVPHDWFSYGRKETDDFWVKSQKDKIRVIITGSTKLDKDIAARRIKSGHKINVSINPLKQNERTYYTLINGYVFKITLDTKIQKMLSKFVIDTKNFESIDYEKIDEIINTPCTCVMKISKNQNKFEKMAAKCGKYFI